MRFFVPRLLKPKKRSWTSCNAANQLHCNGGALCRNEISWGSQLPMRIFLAVVFAYIIKRKIAESSKRMPAENLRLNRRRLRLRATVASNMATPIASQKNVVPTIRKISAAIPRDRAIVRAPNARGGATAVDSRADWFDPAEGPEQISSGGISVVRLTEKNCSQDQAGCVSPKDRRPKKIGKIFSSKPATMVKIGG